MGGVRVRAATVRVRDQFVLARYGKLSRAQYRAAAGPELSSLLGTPGNLWVDFDLFLEATELACRLFGDGTPALAREIGAFGAEANMGPWRALVHRLVDPKVLIELAGMLWTHHYDAGRLQTSSDGPKAITVRLEDFPRPHPMHCASIEGWCRRTVELGRPRSVRFEETACRTRGAASCVFEGRWE